MIKFIKKILGIKEKSIYTYDFICKRCSFQYSITIYEEIDDFKRNYFSVCEYCHQDVYRPYRNNK